MTRIGTHALIWSGEWTVTAAEATLARVAALGYDFVELALARPSSIDVGRTRELLAEHGLACTCGLGLPASAHLPFAPERAETFLVEALEVAAALESPILTGGTYTHLGARTGNPPTEQEKATVARVLKSVAKKAADLGMQLGIENINRYESYLATRVADVLELLDRIGEDNVVCHLDTYHANIEEKGFFGPILAAGERLGYVHLSESDRGVPGSGNVAFDDVFAALSQVGYAGPMVIESFAPLSDEVVATFALWHDPVGDPVSFSAESLAFFQEMAERHHVSPSRFGPFKDG